MVKPVARSKRLNNPSILVWFRIFLFRNAGTQQSKAREGYEGSEQVGQCGWRTEAELHLPSLSS